MSKISNMKGVRVGIQVPTFKTARISQAAPVQNTYYTLADLKNVLVHNLQFEVQTTGETLQIQLTIEGTAITGSLAAAADTEYQCYPHVDQTSAGGVMVSFTGAWGYFNFAGYASAYFKTLKIEIRKTTVVGVGAIRAALTYNQY